MTPIEKALVAAMRAFVHSIENGVSQAQKSAPTTSSNGIPVCSKHGKAMKEGNEKQKKAGYVGPQGYKCTAKNADGGWCTEIA